MAILCMGTIACPLVSALGALDGEIVNLERVYMTCVLHTMLHLCIW